MINVTQQVESLVSIPPTAPKGAAVNVAADVLDDKTGVIKPDGTSNSDGRHYVYRFIQNVSGSGTAVLFSIGSTCSAASFHGQIADGQQLSVNTLERVSCVSTIGAWKCVVVEQYRRYF